MRCLLEAHTGMTHTHMKEPYRLFTQPDVPEVTPYYRLKLLHHVRCMFNGLTVRQFPKLATELLATLNHTVPVITILSKKKWQFKMSDNIITNVWVNVRTLISISC